MDTYLLELFCANTRVQHTTTALEGVYAVGDSKFFREFSGKTRGACYDLAEANKWKISRLFKIGVCPVCRSHGIYPYTIVIQRILGIVDVMTSIVFTSPTTQTSRKPHLITDEQEIMRYLLSQDELTIPVVLCLPDHTSAQSITAILLMADSDTAVKSDRMIGTTGLCFQCEVERSQVAQFAHVLCKMNGGIYVDNLHHVNYF